MPGLSNSILIKTTQLKPEILKGRRGEKGQHNLLIKKVT